jgi:2-aminoadipate transaminase
MPQGAIYMGTFSKIFAPGVRLGWVVAHNKVIDKLAIGMQCTDQCPNSFTQRIVHEYARRGWIEEQVAESVKIYRRKRDLLLEALKRYLPPEASWTVPRGGFFLWVRLPEDVDTYSMFKPAVEEELVAYAAGSSFYPDRRKTSELRLAYSQVKPELIDEGVRRLGRAIDKHRASR